MIDMTDETSLLRVQADEIRKAARKKRAQEKDEKSKPPRHNTKLQKAAEKLPLLNELTQQLLTTVMGSFSCNDILSLIAHLTHYVRTTKTISSRDMTPINEGTEVKIICSSIDAMHLVGKFGVVTSMQSIHAMVQVEDKEYYLFLSDLAPI
jgi:hypothetical protein